MLLNICKQTFHISHVRISQKVKYALMWNLQSIIFKWRWKYWQILKSALVYLYPVFVDTKFLVFTQCRTLQTWPGKVETIPTIFYFFNMIHYKARTNQFLGVRAKWKKVKHMRAGAIKMQILQVFSTNIMK